MRAECEAMAAGLEGAGLSGYEARAYVAMVAEGASTATEVAYRAGMPRTKAYPVLRRLQAKGLASVSGTAPVSCSPAPPGEALGGAARAHAERAASMGRLVEELGRAYEASRGGAGGGRYEEAGPEGAGAMVAAAVGGARSSVHASAGPACAALLAGCRAALAAAAARGASVRAVCPPELAGAAELRALAGCADVRIDESAQDYVVCDGRALVVVDGGSGAAAAVAGGGALAAAHERAFGSAWARARPAAALAAVPGPDADEACRMAGLVRARGLGLALSPGATEGAGAALAAMLEGNGVALSSRGLAEAVAVVDCAMRLECGGRAALGPGGRSISVESPEGGGALAWAAVLRGYLASRGSGARLAHRSSGGRESAHLGITGGRQGL